MLFVRFKVHTLIRTTLGRSEEGEGDGKGEQGVEGRWCVEGVQSEEGELSEGSRVE